MSPPRLLVLSRYQRNGASSRLRTHQYRPYLEAAGFAVEYAPFFGETYLDTLYAGRRNMSEVLGCYGGRARRLTTGARPDLIWLEKEAFPWLPWFCERKILPRNVPIASDYDDAVHIRYQRHASQVVRASLGRKIDGVMRHSAVVLAGNENLADHARGAGATRVETVPTVVDLTRYGRARRQAGSTGKAVVGWIGSPSTWRTQAAPLVPLLADLVEAGLITVRAVGTHSDERRPGFEFCPWSEATEVELIREMDIGIMPLPDDPWTRGKCGYKLIQYMACGLPVIASPVGANRSIVRHGVNGFLADGEREWRSSIELLATNPSTRATFGEHGRRMVTVSYSLQKWGPIVGSLFLQVIGREGNC